MVGHLLHNVGSLYMDLVVLEDPRIQAPSSVIQVTENLTTVLYPEAIVIIEISRMAPGPVVEYLT